MLNKNIKDSIQKDIITCRLRPGSSLQETALANDHGCGRTKIRDALLILASEGFVQLAPNKGGVVAPLDAGQVFCIFEMRVALEKTATVLASKRLDEANISKLKDYKKNILIAQKENDEDLFYIVDPQVHDLIAASTLNHFLQSQIAIMRLHSRRCWYFYRDRGFKEETDYDGLISVIDALCERDGASAASAMFKHLSHFQTAFSKMFSQQMEGLAQL